MDIAGITAENVAKAVGGTVERDGSILCCCPVHEASGRHTPSLVLTITNTRRILFHCRSQNCDAKHFQAIHDHLVKCGLPRSHVGGDRADKENRYTYQHPDGNLCVDQDPVCHQIGEETIPLRGVRRDHEAMVERQARGDAAVV